MHVLIDYLEEQDMSYYDWNIVSGDASSSYISPEAIVRNSTANLRNFEEAVILMHDASDKDSTVKALPTLIEQIQEEMDPGSEGVGMGKVLLGCKFYAVAAGQEAVNISFDVVIASGYSLDSTKETVRQELIRYMKGIALDTPDEENMVAQYMKVIGILANTAGIKDLANLTLNGLAENVIIEADNIPVLGELTMNEAAVLNR